jgi:hypothetical protein
MDYVTTHDSEEGISICAVSKAFFKTIWLSAISYQHSAKYNIVMTFQRFFSIRWVVTKVLH